MSSEPIFNVKRENDVDKFTYDVYFDLGIRVKKDVLNGFAANSEYERKYVIGNAVVKNLQCTVEFVPALSSSNKVVYDVKYKIGSQSVGA